MTTNARPTFREIEVDDDFGRTMRTPGGITRSAAMARAGSDIDRVRPQVSRYVKDECARLKKALRSAQAGAQPDAALVAQAYLASQNLRDVADTAGFPLVGLIARNLCVIFEAVDAAQIDYPAAVVDCHTEALGLALSRRYEGKRPKELPELLAGLSQIVEIARAAAAQAAISGTAAG
ncbi:MAG: hypothetical protein ABSE22_14055 [Xanthobacteraceae bacterium]|jgi:hypothetical protein